MQVCFIGHRCIHITDKLISSLKETVLSLISKGNTVFLFGSRSAFDEISWKVVSALKKEYPEIKRVYVRSAYQYIDKDYEEYLLKSYEETYFPAQIEKAGKYSYVERNFEMINKATFCIFYYDENYILPKSNSGTKIAYEYAIKKKKQIINLCK